MKKAVSVICIAVILLTGAVVFGLLASDSSVDNAWYTFLPPAGQAETPEYRSTIAGFFERLFVGD